jgi:plasmid stabilization system protein ParE
VIVIITDEAEVDLEEIGDYIARNSPRRAVSFVDELVDRCERLVSMHNSFPFVSGHEHTGVRRRPYGEYLIFYRFDEAGVKVLRILNGARDHESIVFPEP